MSYQSECRREPGDVVVTLTGVGWLLERNLDLLAPVGPFAEFTTAVQHARLLARRDMVRAWLDEGARYRWIPLDDSPYADDPAREGPRC